MPGSAQNGTPPVVICSSARSKTSQVTSKRSPGRGTQCQGRATQPNGVVERDAHERPQAVGSWRPRRSARNVGDCCLGGDSHVIVMIGRETSVCQAPPHGRPVSTGRDAGCHSTISHRRTRSSRDDVRTSRRCIDICRLSGSGPARADRVVATGGPRGRLEHTIGVVRSDQRRQHGDRLTAAGARSVARSGPPLPSARIAFNLQLERRAARISTADVSNSMLNLLARPLAASTTCVRNRGTRGGSGRSPTERCAAGCDVGPGHERAFGLSSAG
jgi:hypothetical protein